MSARRVDHVAPSGTREVRVVEDDPANARRQLFVEGLGELPQGSASLVAVEADVVTGDVLLGDTALPGSGNTHDQDDVRVVPRARRAAASPSRFAELAGKDVSVVVLEVELRCAGGGAGGLRSPGTRDRNHGGGELE